MSSFFETKAHDVKAKVYTTYHNTPVMQSINHHIRKADK
jgi:hypothetical protein